MTDRFSLRIETGERAGDIIPLSISPFLIGRGNDCDLQLKEASVSTRHAELRSENGTVKLHDLGSTNGTRIGRLKVGEAELEEGLSFSLGDVRMTLVLDSSVASAKPKPDQEPALAVKAGGVGGDGLEGELELEWDDSKSSESTGASEKFPKASAQTKFTPRVDASLGADEMLDGAKSVTADHLAQAGRRSPVPLLILAGSVLAAAGAYYFWSQSDAGESQADSLPSVAGDLLGGSGHFETDLGWSAREDWPAAFSPARSASASGAQGLSAELGEGERAWHVSEPVRLSGLAKFTLTAQAFVEGDVAGRLGLRFTTDAEEGSGPAAIAWGPWIKAGDTLSEWTWSGTAAEGFTSAQVVIGAWAPGKRPADSETDWQEVGRVAVDELHLVETGKGAHAASVDEVTAVVIGDPGSTAVIRKIDRILLTGIQVHSGWRGALMGLSVQADELGLRLEHPESSQGVWVLNATSRLADGGVSTMGADGYLPRRLEFDSEGVTDLVLGTGSDLVRVVLGEGCRVEGRPTGAGFRFQIHGLKGGGLLVKTRFADEFKTALRLATEAKEATGEKRYGDALAKWKELLDRYPYEADDVARADAARTGLLREGYGALRGLEAEWQRASFFGLRRGFEDCETRVTALAERYQGSELMPDIETWQSKIRAELAKYETASESKNEHMQTLEHILTEAGAERLRSALTDAPKRDSE